MKKLSELKKGERGKVLKVTGEPYVKNRLLTMGIIPGTEVVVSKLAPLGDPMDIIVKGYHLSLRKEEARCIEVEVI